jgi:DNA-binding winged helix-turn-helix (wHTH) protein
MGPAVPPPRTLRFGVFEINVRSGELCKQGRKVRLEGQPVQILLCLLENPGELVTRDELRQRLWPADTYVNFEHGLNAAVKRLRQALNDSAGNPRFVETLPRRGYRFLAPVQIVNAAEEGPNQIDIPPAELASGAADLPKAKGRLRLRVISRTSAMTYKGAHKSVPQIAGELNVDAVIEGTVLRSGD